MALVETYVDPDATGAGTGVDWTNAYTSLNAWDAAEQTNLVSDGDNHTVHLRSSAGSDDTTVVSIAGWTTDATHLITITQDDFPADGILDETKYIHKTSNTIGIYTAEDFVNFDKLQISVSAPSSNTYALYVNGVTAVCSINYNKCIINCSSVTGDTFCAGFRSEDGDTIATMSNCIITGFLGANGYGIFQTSGSLTCYNCTVYNNHIGAWTIATLVSTNCAVGNNVNDFFNGTIDHCCSDDGDGTNAVAPNAGGWTDVFTDPANGDFSLKLGSTCIDAGTNTGAPSTDIIGTARPQNLITDIGAFEFLASTGVITPYYYQLMAG